MSRKYPDIASAARSLRSGATTSVDLTLQCLKQIGGANDQLVAMVDVYAESAIAAASAADDERSQGIDRGPLHGVPLAIKDVIATQEGPTRAGGVAWADDWHRFDAESVARLRAVGAVMIGKTLTMEFACGMPSKSDGTSVSMNPWGDGVWAGGSSSGAAAGVAVGMFYGGLGTDTGGSIRCPSSYCGLSGIKPTWGLVPTEGAIPWAFSLDHLGPIGRTALDCSTMLAALTAPDAPWLTGHPLAGATSPPSLAGLRIGVERANHLTSDVVHADVIRAFDEALEVLKRAGAHLVDVELANYVDVCNAAMLITPAEGYAFHRENLRHRWSEYGSNTRVQIAAGAVIGASDYVQARRLAVRAQEDVAELFAGVDLIVTPTTATPAPRIEELYGADLRRLITDTIYTPYWDVTGNPAMSIPMGFADGLPLGLQIIGPRFADFAVLAAGIAYQEVTNWHEVEAPERVLANR